MASLVSNKYENEGLVQFENTSVTYIKFCFLILMKVHTLDKFKDKETLEMNLEFPIKSFSRILIGILLVSIKVS